MDNVIIKMKNVSKSYKNITVVKDLSLDFIKGKSYGIKGYNGSGKSVILKLIVGFAFADSGEIIVNEKVLKKDVDFIENAGVFINSPEFINSLSGLDNLLYLSEIKGKITKEEIEDVLKVVDIYAARLKKVSTYSQGMKQRLRLAQAIMESPDILILDEPMNALDRDGVELVKRILKKHIEEGKTLIFTSHNLDDFTDLADEVYEIEKGAVSKVSIS